MQLGALDDLDDIAEHGLAPLDDSLLVATVEQDFKQLGQHQKQAQQYQMRAASIRTERSRDERSLDRLDTDIGAREVEDVLGRIAYGVYS
ncbi:MAG: DUF2384 domain-containing protein [Deltaproteobacteria bacterium]|nr:DUF2384 domain-containing protein [Deltaproteobacteria bacterium]